MPVIARNDWMSKIDDKKKISEIAIPGRMSFEQIIFEMFYPFMQIKVTSS